MPATTTVRHPKKATTITFTEADHSYVDSDGFVYKSVTSFVKDLFPVFNAQKASELVAKKQGVSQAEILATWDANRDAACRYGTRCHETAEAVFKATPPPHKPESEKERNAFRAIWDRASKIKAALHVCGSEILLFDPDLRIAGTVDLLCFDKAKNTYMLLDWKTNKSIDRSNGFKEKALPPLQHVENCNFEHYSAQLAIYELLMRRNGYIPADAKISASLLWLNESTGSVELIQCSNRAFEVFSAIIKDVLPPF